MKPKPLHAGIKALLEFGPTVGFVIAYLVFRNDTFTFHGTNYSGFVVVTAAFLPVFAIATALLWRLTGTIARLQVAIAVMVLVFGALSVWLNDSRLFKMKPTVIYLGLALFLSVGLWRGQVWLKFIMEDVVPLKRKGWMILTKRLIAVCLLAAAANELVWRTQSERFWVLFETLVMPVLIVAFFVTQIGLFIEYATLKSSKRKHR